MMMLDFCYGNNQNNYFHEFDVSLEFLFTNSLLIWTMCEKCQAMALGLCQWFDDISFTIWTNNVCSKCKAILSRECTLCEMRNTCYIQNQNNCQCVFRTFWSHLDLFLLPFLFLFLSFNSFILIPSSSHLYISWHFAGRWYDVETLYFLSKKFLERFLQRYNYYENDRVSLVKSGI